MSREYTTIENQNMYDITAQKFGALNNIDKVMRQMPDINEPSDIGVDMLFDDTTDNLAVKFDANRRFFATGNKSEIAPLYEIFDDTFDDTFN